MCVCVCVCVHLQGHTTVVQFRGYMERLKRQACRDELSYGCVYKGG